MIAVAALVASSAAAPDPWFMVGVTDSRLRVFIDRTSISRDADRRRARIRIGSPDAITGRIVLVYQDEAIDCAARTWQLLGYDARDENDHGVKAEQVTTPAVKVAPDSIGDAVVSAVCRL